MNYIIKWGQYLQTTDKALQMRMQMGWTQDRTDKEWDSRSFVIGRKEITRTGETIEAPSSPFVRGLSRHITQNGTFERWRDSIDYLNKRIDDDKLVKSFDTSIEALTEIWKTKHAKPRIKQLVKKERNNNDTLFYDDLTVLPWESAKEKYLCQVGR